MTRVSTYGQHLLNQSHIQRLQTRVKDVNTQISSGKVAQQYSEFPTKAGQLLSLERSQTRTDQYQKNINLALGRLDMVESNFNTLVDQATYVAGQLANAVSAGNWNVLELTQMAEGYLEEVSSLLNAEHQDRYLFAGSRADSPPVDLSTMGMEVAFSVADPTVAGSTFSINIPGVGTITEGPFTATDGNDLAAQVSASFPGDLTAQWVPGATAPAGELVITDAQGRAIESAQLNGSSGTVTARYHNGDNQPMTVRADDEFELKYGFTADAAGLEKLVRGLTYVRDAGTAGLTDAEQKNLLDEAFTLVKESITGISEMRSELGAKYSVLEATNKGHENFLNYASTAVSDLEDTDIALAMTQLSQEQVQLEASFMVLARINQISLANYL